MSLSGVFKTIMHLNNCWKWSKSGWAECREVAVKVQRRERAKFVPWKVSGAVGWAHKHWDPFPENKRKHKSERCCKCTCTRRIPDTQCTHTFWRRCTLSHRTRKNPKSEIKLSALGGVGAVRDADRKDFCSIPTITKIASQSHKVCRRSRLPKSYESFRLDWMCVAKLEKLGEKLRKKWMVGLEKKIKMPKLQAKNGAAKWKSKVNTEIICSQKENRKSFIFSFASSFEHKVGE